MNESMRWLSEPAVDANVAVRTERHDVTPFVGTLRDKAMSLAANIASAAKLTGLAPSKALYLRVSCRALAEHRVMSFAPAAGLMRFVTALNCADSRTTHARSTRLLTIPATLTEAVLSLASQCKTAINAAFVPSWMVAAIARHAEHGRQVEHRRPAALANTRGISAGGGITGAAALRLRLYSPAAVCAVSVAGHTFTSMLRIKYTTTYSVVGGQ